MEATTTNSSELGAMKNGGDLAQEQVERADRKTRISLRESRVSQKPNTQRIRQDLNELRERLANTAITPQRSEDEVDEEKKEARVGNLHLVFISDTEISYRNEKIVGPKDENEGSVTITVGYKSFEIHKSILANSSQYFVNKFETDPELTVIDLGSQVGVNGFTLILDFLYDGVAVLSPRIGEIVFETAAALDITWIKDAAIDYLMRQVQPSNYRAVHSLFEKHQMTTDCHRVVALVSQHLVEFSDDINFLRTLQYDLLKRILAENFFIDGTEGFVVKTILDWVQIDEARNERLSFLIKHVRFPLLEPEELLSMPENIRKISGINKEIDAAMEYVCNIAAQYKYEGEMYLGRGYRDVMMLMSATESNNGGVIMYKDLNKMEEPMCLENVHPLGLQTMLVYTSQTTLGNFVYAAGGLDEAYSITGRMFRYDPRIRDWQQLAAMTNKRMAFGMAASKTNILAVGGESQSDNGKETILNTAEMYDPEENRWNPVTPFPLATAECAAAYCFGKYYVSGGVNSKGQDCMVLGDIYVYDVKKNNWEKLKDMPTPRFGHNIATIGSKIYVIGGRKQGDEGSYIYCREVDVYDTIAGLWHTSGPLPEDVGHINKHMAVIGDDIAFLSNSRWWLYETKSGETTVGEYSGTDVQRVAYLKVAYPPPQTF